MEYLWPCGDITIDAKLVAPALGSYSVRDRSAALAAIEQADKEIRRDATIVAACAIVKSKKIGRFFVQLALTIKETLVLNVSTSEPNGYEQRDEKIVLVDSGEIYVADGRSSSIDEEKSVIAFMENAKYRKQDNGKEFDYDLRIDPKNAVIIGGSLIFQYAATSASTDANSSSCSARGNFACATHEDGSCSDTLPTIDSVQSEGNSDE